MQQINVTCSYCGGQYRKGRAHFLENMKLGHKNFCSLKCLIRSRRNGVILSCENPLCHNLMLRIPSSVSYHNFCSSRCLALTINPSHPTYMKCGNQYCHNLVIGKKYCSQKCQPKRISQYSKLRVLEIIREFYTNSGRIPTKRDLNKVYRAARLHFGSWNKAIIASGFVPNKELFSKKHTSRDGHRCDSLSEKIIDDWLFSHNIEHKRNFPYPGSEGFSVDFLIFDYWIEFFGLDRQLKRYDELKKRKLTLAKKYSLKLVALYPKDLFPKFLVDKKLKFLI